jgi:hypothetical protein
MRPIHTQLSGAMHAVLSVAGRLHELGSLNWPGLSLTPMLLLLPSQGTMICLRPGQYLRLILTRGHAIREFG